MEPTSARVPPLSTPEQEENPSAPTELRWTTDQILQGSKEAIIVHGQSVYRLRLTRSGKLILHK